MLASRVMPGLKLVGVALVAALSVVLAYAILWVIVVEISVSARMP